MTPPPPSSPEAAAGVEERQREIIVRRLLAHRVRELPQRRSKHPDVELAKHLLARAEAAEQALSEAVARADRAERERDWYESQWQAKTNELVEAVAREAKLRERGGGVADAAVEVAYRSGIATKDGELHAKLASALALWEDTLASTKGQEVQVAPNDAKDLAVAELREALEPETGDDPATYWRHYAGVLRSYGLDHAADRLSAVAAALASTKGQDGAVKDTGGERGER